MLPRSGFLFALCAFMPVLPGAVLAQQSCEALKDVKLDPISGQGTDIRVYAIDQNTGSLSLMADYSNYGNTSGIGVIDHETRYAYFVGESSPNPTGPTVCTLEGSAVNPTTGALTPLPGPGAPLPVCSFSMAIVRPQ